MRALLALALLASVLASVPSTAAAVTLPEELCNPGSLGVCHWYTDSGQCAVASVGTMWAGACADPKADDPVRACSTLVTPLWRGWCPQDGNAVEDALAELLP